MVFRHGFRSCLRRQNWVRSFKLLDTGLAGAGEMQPKLVGEVCARECLQDLAREDAERQRRRGTRRVGCWGENGLVSSGTGERGLR